MLARKRKKRKGFNIQKFLYILVFCILFVFLTYSAINLFLKRQAFQKEINILEQEKEELLKQRESLKFSLGEAYSEAYLEKTAREDLNLQKPGERVFVIKKEAEAKKEENQEIIEQTFLEKVKSFFGW